MQHFQLRTLQIQVQIVHKQAQEEVNFLYLRGTYSILFFVVVNTYVFYKFSTANNH